MNSIGELTIAVPRGVLFDDTALTSRRVTEQQSSVVANHDAAMKNIQMGARRCEEDQIACLHLPRHFAERASRHAGKTRADGR